MQAPPPIDGEDRPPAARTLGLAALGLALSGLLLEAAGLDPRGLAAWPAPGAAAWRLAVAGAQPYLTAAVSVALLALACRLRDVPTVGRKPTWWALVLALVAAQLGAAQSPAPLTALLDGDSVVDAGSARLGGWTAPAFALHPVALEDAGALAGIEVPAASAARAVTVRWVGRRAEAGVSSGTQVELVGGSERRDLTADYRALQPGEARLYSRVLRLGPEPARVSLRLDQDPVPPIDFLDARRAADFDGVAIDAGGGDRAARVDPRPGAVGVPALVIEGAHVEGGHAVVVASGEAWGEHDLRALARVGGELQIGVLDDGHADWSVRLVGAGGAEGPLLPLSAFTVGTEGASEQRVAPLTRLIDDPLSPSRVVGVALIYSGPPGPFRLVLAGARAARAGGARSGYQIATLGVLDPAGRPPAAMLAAGVPGAGGGAARALLLRAGAAVLLLVGMVGPAALWSVLRRLPVLAPLALVGGPLVALGLGPVLRVAVEPRLEQEPLALGALALSGVALALAPPRTDAARDSGSPLAAWAETLLGLGALGAVALHASADPGGGAWQGYAASERLGPDLVRNLAGLAGLPVLVGATFLMLAARPQVPGQARALARSLLPPLLVWSLVYLVVRHAKAAAFGYEDNYRRELAEGASWLGYLLRGSAQYHLHLLPLILVLLLFLPLMRRALAQPAWGLLLLPAAVARPLLDQWAWTAVSSPDLRSYAQLLSLAVGLLGVAVFAFALEAVALRPVARRWVRLAALLVLGGGVAVLVSAALRQTPPGIARQVLDGLLPAATLASVRLWEPGAWAQPLRAAGRVGFGVYLLHPVLLDLAEIVERGSGLTPSVRVALNLVAVAALSVAGCALLARVGPLRGLLGLRPPALA